jgi:DNA-directed RNA polymerase
VANVTNDKLMNTEGEAREIAKNLLSIGIDRKITKRQVMVVPYAGSFSSCMDYTREALFEERWEKGVYCPWDNGDKQIEGLHNNMLAKYIWQSIDEVVVKAKEAMKWMTTAARVYVKAINKQQGSARARAITWTTPDGFLVHHYVVDEKKGRLDTYLDGRVNLVFWERTDKLDSRGTATALPPNFVHSMDACLLRMAVLKAAKLDRPITSFCMIHDSFGVHASRMAEFLSACVRPAFVEMYQRDVLADLRDRLLLAPGVELEPLPARGSLDLNGVLESEFFFS